MTQEEKAKRYDEALHKAKNYYSTTDSSSDIKLIGLIFPELKESDDEKIRKALVEMVHDTTGDSLWIDYNVHKEDALAWLEKQGEHANFRNKIQIGDKVTRNRDGMLVNLSQLKRVAKKQGEQKKELFQELDKKLKNALENETTESLEKFLNEQKPAWSEEDENAIQVLKGIVKYSNEINENIYTIPLKEKLYDWLKSLKDRVQPQLQQEWNEEDEEHIMAIDLAVNRCIGKWDCCGEKCPISEHSPWFKSLKDRHAWKPSDEQIETLEQWLRDNRYKGDARYSYPIFDSLYQDLKKLKG